MLEISWCKASNGLLKKVLYVKSLLKALSSRFCMEILQMNLSTEVELKLYPQQEELAIVLSF